METIIRNNKIVEEIHNLVLSMDGKIDSEVQRRLKLAHDKEYLELAENAKNLGFNKSKSVTMLNKKNVLKDERMNDLLNEYFTLYPGYKFISDSDLKFVVKKYNLVMGIPELFKEEIPLDGLRALQNFPIGKKSEPFSFIDKYSIDLKREIDEKINELGTDRIRSILRDYSLSEDDYKIFNEGVEKAKSNKNNSLFVIASEHMFDIPEMYRINENTNKIELSLSYEGGEFPRVQDPIIAYKVPKGAIIVYAWGIEAEDPLVLNEQMN